MHDYSEILASVIAGTGLSSILMRFIILKSLKDIESISSKLADIQTELAKISIRLESLDKSHSLVHAIDRKVVGLEARVYGKHPRAVSSNPAE